MSYAANRTNRTNLRLQGGWRRDAADTRRKPPCSPYPRSRRVSGLVSGGIQFAGGRRCAGQARPNWGMGRPEMGRGRAQAARYNGHKVKAYGPADKRCLALQSLALAWPGALEVKGENGAQVEKQDAGPVLEVPSLASAPRGKRRECRRQGGDGTGARWRAARNWWRSKSRDGTGNGTVRGPGC